MSGSERAVFADIDGTLVHYTHLCDHDVHLIPSKTDLGALVCEIPVPEIEGCVTQVLALPTSSTGLKGYISLRTLSLLSQIRQDGKAPLVLLSGARTATILQRLPYLPVVDAIVTENGGRIFLRDASWASNMPIREDLEWRYVQSATAGAPDEESKAPMEREGALWDMYRQLTLKGYACDATSYTTCFRVSVPEDKPAGEQETMEKELEAMLQKLPADLQSTYNLGKADIYPATSGKAEAAKYLMKHFGCDPAKCVALVDDDNDVLLSQAVGKVYLPSVSSDSMAKQAKAEPAKYVQASRPFVFGAEEAIGRLAIDWEVLKDGEE